MQNVFMKLWKHGKPFENDEHIDKWLTTVCINIKIKSGGHFMKKVAIIMGSDSDLPVVTPAISTANPLKMMSI